MQALLAPYELLVGQIVARYDGQQLSERGESDGIAAVFTSADAALAAAWNLQQALGGQAIASPRH